MRHGLLTEVMAVEKRIHCPHQKSIVTCIGALCSATITAVCADRCTTSFADSEVDCIIEGTVLSNRNKGWLVISRSVDRR